MLSMTTEQNLSSEGPSEQIPPQIKSTKNEGGFWEIVKFTLIALAIVIPIRIFIAQPFVVSGESMYPTFENGDYLIIDEISYRLGEPERGDVIVFRYPLQPDRFFIKRVIALPGETMTFKNGVITISDDDTSTDDITLDEPYIKENSKGKFKITLNNDEYFVMGDNRNASSDSRVWGALPRKDITGRVLVRLLPVKEISILPGDYKQSSEQ